MEDREVRDEVRVEQVRIEGRKLLGQELDLKLISEIRSAVNTGLVLGNERFKREVEALTGQRQRHLKRGPMGSE